ncbi:MAG: hypothetical protein E4H20_05720 [Spirochaetales bacterium]|nr:MAG: hypothetical protein E4H20_05720 [Spirochaetales bacterium]
MSDTFHLPAGDGIFFGKNSDRNANEPQALLIAARRTPSDSVIFNDRSFDVPDAGHSMILSCPTWMPGAEMGVNEKGVAIGNEAVFSKYKPAPDGVLGMDLLRAALMASSSAEEARDILITLTERHPQGGNGAFKGTLVYNNSYIISGPDGAYVLETAAARWAWRKLDEATAISNSYSLTVDYKRVDPVTRKGIALVNERMACLDEADAGRVAEKESWKAYVENRLMARITEGDARRRSLEALLPAAAESGGRQAAMALLRAHGAVDPLHPSKNHNLCCHDGDLWGNPTTASMLVERGTEPGRFIVWFTGASYACANLFKPVLFDGEFKPLWTEYDYTEGSRNAERYWLDRLAANKAIRRKPSRADERASELAKAQSEIGSVIDGFIEQNGQPSNASLAKAAKTINAAVRAWDSRF